jgi:hypothetical protein
MRILLNILVTTLAITSNIVVPLESSFAAQTEQPVGTFSNPSSKLLAETDAAKKQKAEQEAQRQKKREEAAAIQKKKAEEAAALRVKKQEEAALNKKKADELATERKKQQEDASLSRKKKADELAAERKKQQEDASLSRKKKADELAAEQQKRQEEASSARKKKADELAAEQQKRQEEASSARKKKVDELAAEKKKKQEEAALAKKKKADELAAEQQKKRDELACKNVEVRSSGNRSREFGRNSTWTSCKYKLHFQGDGNFVLIDPSGKVLWATGTEGRATKLALKPDGNVVLYDKQAKAVWATNTDRSPGAFFALQRDGNFVVYNGGNPIWATNTSGGKFTTVSAASNWNPTASLINNPVVKPPKPIVTIPQPKVNELACKNVEVRSSGNRSREFGRNSTWISCKYKLHFQGDGNLVLIDPSGKVLWATGTEGRATKLAVQSDGNVVLYDKQAKALWATNTDRNPGAFFALQRDGNFVVYNGSNPIWATNTSGGTFTTVSAASNWQGSGNQTVTQVPSPPPSSKKPPIAHEPIKQTPPPPRASQLNVNKFVKDFPLGTKQITRGNGILPGQCVTLIARYLENHYNAPKHFLYSNGGQTAATVAQLFPNDFSLISNTDDPIPGSIISFPNAAKSGDCEGGRLCGHVALVVSSTRNGNNLQVTILDSNWIGRVVDRRSLTIYNPPRTSTASSSDPNYGSGISWVNPKN